MKKRTLRIISALLLPALMCLCLSGCGGAKAASELSFSAGNSISQLRALDGKSVTIVGYMATMSPPDGKYIYLMNLPYQSCPFCVPNTTQLANTMAVYARKNKSFEFTDQAVRVNGTLKVEPYSDEFGYEYEYRIVDAEIRPIDMSPVRGDYALWTSLASDGVISEIYAMFDYLHFVCQWSDYFLNYVDENNVQQQVNMYPGDVYQYLENDAYGYQKESAVDYFQDLIARVRAVSPDKLEDLVQILKDCESVRAYALDELNGGQYEYVEDLDKYKQTHYDDLYERWWKVYCDFTVDWIARWQL